MKALKQYAQVSAWTPENGDLLRLYKMIMAGYDRNEAKEAFQISDNHFSVVCKRFKEHMIQGVLNNSLKGLNRFQRIRYSIRKQYESAILLLLLEKKDAGIPLARATMRKAEKYGLFQVALDLSRKLRTYYSMLDTNTKHYKYYTEKQKKYKRELDLELEAEDIMFEFSFNIRKGLLLEGIEDRLQNLEKKESSSYWFHYMIFICKASWQQVSRKENEVLATCYKALKYFESRSDLPYFIYFSFYFRAIAVHIARREYSLAETLINKSLDGPVYGEHNWQIIMLQRALLGFHSGKTAITLDAYLKALKVPKKKRTTQIGEQWQIIRAYLELYEVDVPGPWRLSRFLNSVQMSSADKAGNFVAIKIAELMHLLKRREFEKYTYRCERLDPYIDQHLKGKKLDRYVHFLRLLQCIVRGGFQKEEVLKKAKKYLHGLKETAPRIGADVREVEIVPFEALWEMAMGIL
ncbi:MAG: hypothetical protein AAFZ15_19415 [Bacteroidota bacterium]